MPRLRKLAHARGLSGGPLGSSGGGGGASPALAMLVAASLGVGMMFLFWTDGSAPSGDGWASAAPEADAPREPAPSNATEPPLDAPPLTVGRP